MEGEYLNSPVNSIWVRRDDDAPWAFMFMLLDTDGDDWVYRRLPAIRGRISDMGLHTKAGVPYLSPEIQLLYKAKNYRPKDMIDLHEVIPNLPVEKVRWLLACLRQEYPAGHDWIAHIEQYVE